MPHAAPRFGYFQAQQRKRPVATVEEPTFKVVELLLQPARKAADRHAVGTMAAAILAHPFEGGPESSAGRKLRDHRLAGHAHEYKMQFQRTWGSEAPKPPT